MKKKLITSVVLASLLGGCSYLDDKGHQENAFTGERERNELSTGAFFGAGVGIVASTFLSGGSSEIIYAALVGTSAFASLGLSNDLKSRDTLAFLREQGITVENGYDTITVSFAENITFDSEKTDLKEDFLPVVEAVSLLLKKLEGNATFEVVGHADYTGPASLNKYLSEERATVVTEALIKEGVSPSGFVDFKGMSSSKPKDYCLDLECLRRVEIVIHKNDILYKL